ncbi:hypothetical protein D9Q98_008758 [Chlorella vulgaris]|uniref:Glycoside hydrolase family 5 domain-containing protein n=1 Tax=Chlorella vulgaris TaxID=3077 RepID=A0A9D4TIP8_CHLVU|nr:hypothetical protein D9Q98_008758 [Chlorella vulgaris]
MARLACTVACLSLLLSATARSQTASALPPSLTYQPPPISPTVYVSGMQDLRLDGSGASKCTRLVEAAAAYGFFTQAQFLVSILWWDSGPPDTVDCSNYTFSTPYCFSRFNATEILYWSYGDRDPATNAAIPVTQDQVDEFSGLLGRCLERAVALGLDVAVNVHADDGRQLNGWRNTLDFDPLEPYGNFSFYDAMLAPIADALSRVLPDNSTAWMSLQGEMGATVFFHPSEWSQVADMVRQRIAQARPELAGRVRLGLGINNSKLCGCVLIDIVDYDEYLAEFEPRWPQIEGWFDLPAIRAAFEAVDFVGISAYVAQNSTDFPVCDMEKLMKKMDIEFAYYGLTLHELVDMGKEIVWIEWGVGGGASQNGNTPAETGLEAAYFPFWGVFGPYDVSKDPWKNASVQEYLHHYVNQTSAYLLQGGCDYQVGGVYLWSCGGSWDVIGLSNPVYGQAGSFRDEGAVDIIRAHNEEVQA